MRQVEVEIEDDRTIIILGLFSYFRATIVFLITVTMRANLRHINILHSSKGCGKRGKPVVKEARKRDNEV